MLIRQQSAGMMVAAGMALFSVGCFGNKSKDVATTAVTPPPAAAYPDTSSALAGATNGAPGAVPAVPSSATMAATNRSAAPATATAPAAALAPFSLREGEQLVSHLIQSGESLSSIATKYNTSVGRIQSANGMTATKIIAGKTLQVPTSAPPASLAQNVPPSGGLYGSPVSASPSAPSYSAPSVGAYPGTLSPPSAPIAPAAPSAPTYPSTSPSPGAIAAPPVPQGTTFPGYPSSTSYPRTIEVPAPSSPAASAPTPSFEGSRIQFPN